MTVIAVTLTLAFFCAMLAALSLRADLSLAPGIVLDAKTLAAERRLQKEFPGVGRFFLARIENPDAAKAAEIASLLAEGLAARGDLFASVSIPGTGPFYETYGVLFARAEDIEANVKAALRMQPLYHALGSAPDIAGLASLVAKISRAVDGGRSPSSLAGLLLAASASLEAEIKGEKRPVDWRLLLGLVPEMKSSTWFVIAEPLPAKGRDAASFARGLTRGSPGVSWIWPSDTFVPRGDPVSGVAVPAGLAAIASLVLLVGGLGSLRLALPVILAVAAATSFAAGAALTLSPSLDRVSWTFPAAALAASLVMGCTVVLGYAQARLKGVNASQAVMLAAQSRGALVLAQGGAFLCFWSPWIMLQIGSLAELGAVAIVSIAASAVLALTLVPAALAAFDGGRVHVHWLDDAVARRLPYHAGQMLQIVVMVLASGGLFCTVFLPGLKFGEATTPASPPVRLESPDNRGAVHLISAPGEATRVLVKKLSAVREVGAIRWIEQFMPPDADRKITALRMLASYLPGLPAPRNPAAGDDVAASLTQLEYNLRQVADNASADEALRQAAHRLRRAVSLFSNPEPPRASQVLALEDSIFSGLFSLSRHTDSLSNLAVPSPEMLEPSLRRRFVSQSGLWRIEVMPKPGVGQLSFAAALRKIEPGAAGEPIAAIARNEIMHHETYLAFAVALAAAAIVALIFLRDAGLWLLSLLPLGIFITISAAFAVSFTWLIGGLGLAATATASALCIAASLSLAERASRIAATSDSRNTAFRASVLPLCVLSPIAVALTVSSYEAVSDFGTQAAVLLLTALAANVFLVPQGARWLRNMGY